MSDMKCPICQTVLDKALLSDKVRGCPKCKNIGNIDLWQELIRTHKALDVAVDALKTVRRYTAINQFAPKSREAHIVAKKAVAKITALEQQP